MDLVTRIRYLDARIVHGEDLLGLLQRRGEEQAALDLLKQLQELKRQREELAQIHTPSKNLVVERADDGFEPWMLREWRRVSIPEWQRILQESLDQGDKKREEYARWMLREVLLDPEYKESGP